MASLENPTRNEVQSVQRAIAVLKAFSIERPLLGVAEIAQVVGLNRSTVHRLVGTLESCGMIRRDPYQQKYSLSAQVLKLADVFLEHSDLRSVALPRMTTLRDMINETVALHLREGASRIVIAQVGAHRDVRHMYRNIGEPIPLHLGAPGKVMLANMSEEEIESYLTDVPLIEATPHSITDPLALRDELKRIAHQGYAVSSEERRLGVVAIAAPIFDATGVPLASINASGPSHRIRKAQVAAIRPLLVDAAKEISRAMGHIESES